MGIKWQVYVINSEVLEKANIPSIESMLLTRQGRAPVSHGRHSNGQSRALRQTWQKSPTKALEEPVEAPAHCSRHPRKILGNIARDRDSWRATTKARERGLRGSEIGERWEEMQTKESVSRTEPSSRRIPMPTTVNSLVSGHPRELCPLVELSAYENYSQKRTPKKNRVDVRLPES